MAITNSKLIPYRDRIVTILGTLMDKNLTQAQALGRLPKAKASIEKLIDTLLKSKDKVNDAIIIAEIDEIVAMAEKGLAEFGSKFMGNSITNDLPGDPFAEDTQAQTIEDVIYSEKNVENVNKFKAVLENALNKDEGTTVDTASYQSPEEQIIEEGYFIYKPNGRLKAFGTEAELAVYLDQVDKPEDLFIIKGKKVKAKVQRNISFE